MCASAIKACRSLKHWRVLSPSQSEEAARQFAQIVQLTDQQLSWKQCVLAAALLASAPPSVPFLFSAWPALPAITYFSTSTLVELASLQLLREAPLYPDSKFLKEVTLR